MLLLPTALVFVFGQLLGRSEALAGALGGYALFTIDSLSRFIHHA